MSGVGSGVGFGNELAGRTESIVDRYHGELLAAGSILVSDPAVWIECETQARHIVADCASTLMMGSASVARNTIRPVFEIAARRGARGIRPYHFVRAGTILFEIIATELGTLAARGAESEMLLTANTVLAQSIFGQLEADVRCYEAYALDEVTQAVESERASLARDLHDHVGTGISIAMRRLEIIAVSNPQVCVKAAVGALQNALSEATRVAGQLRINLHGRGLRAALIEFVESMSLLTPVVYVRVNGVEDWVSDEILEQTFLMVRECLRNAIEHANASWVAVDLNVTPHDVSVLVTDDGMGFDIGKVSRRNGLDSLAQRARSMSGKATISSSRREGTQVSIWLPAAADVIAVRT
ncbi:sensor histidine kinase [Rhodococcus rhodochrous]|uniref:sensor histidine kinase n=1 Tax=Rhodococcus rhodochrous TaxID=1829 RepID=UPI001E3C3ACB|nr:ATP-binding protein [Rhodococcus rhodochrous]MCD2100406.1 histidine kinase [Rhodococcus rhodochrous]MCD2124730.1 histidine kinase [Rhodococcus rhodochrous]MCQ4138078.1 histidine kinase [Rhodococcus rhodochrous]MDJ0021582.1 histidine kinase [Rhodococcus rhodochrous]